MAEFRRGIALAVVPLCLALSGMLVASDHRAVPPPPSLLLDGVVLRLEGGEAVVAAVPPDAAQEYLPGSRVAAGDRDTAPLARAQARWLAAGRVPGATGRWGELVTGALLDLHTLEGATYTSGAQAVDGAVVAGWIPTWRQVWPRDASFVAVALARGGHVGDAIAVLEFLQSQQRADGGFAARHLPTGGAVADGRADQLDAAGYVLWAARLVLAEADDGAREDLDPLIVRATAHLMDATAGKDPLPAPSSDSWEVREDRLTLGTASATLMGLDSAALLAGPDTAVAIGERRDAVKGRIISEFSAGGFQRYANPAGSLTAVGRQGADANVALLLPPFQTEAVQGASAAWRRSLATLREPAGGISPGEGWRNDGVSWTPQTTLYAWVAAENGESAIAANLLDWTGAHLTASGAIPEKVTADGEPRSVAPLTWSAANVVLAVDALERTTSP